MGLDDFAVGISIGGNLGMPIKVWAFDKTAQLVSLEVPGHYSDSIRLIQDLKEVRKNVFIN